MCCTSSTVIGACMLEVCLVPTTQGKRGF